MPAPTMTPTEAQTDYGLTVSQIDLNDAATQILALTYYSLAEHVDDRAIATGDVRRAWAIVASRLRETTAGDVSRHVSAESERDYSYSEDIGSKNAQVSVMSGAPNQLLGYTAGFIAYDDTDRQRMATATRDDYGVVITTGTRII